MKLSPWHIMIGILLITTFFSILGLVAYLLYGPGINIVVPDAFRNFGVKTSTTTEETARAKNLIDSKESRRLEGLEVITTPPPSSVPTPDEVLTEQAGTFFECTNEEALKAEFLEKSVRLALSDGRVVRLPQIVTDDGEILYANTDGSFAFRNIKNIVFIEEGGVVTYKDCVAL